MTVRHGRTGGRPIADGSGVSSLPTFGGCRGDRATSSGRPLAGFGTACGRRAASKATGHLKRVDLAVESAVVARAESSPRDQLVGQQRVGHRVDLGRRAVVPGSGSMRASAEGSTARRAERLDESGTVTVHWKSSRRSSGIFARRTRRPRPTDRGHRPGARRATRVRRRPPPAGALPVRGMSNVGHPVASRPPLSDGPPGPPLGGHPATPALAGLRGALPGSGGPAGTNSPAPATPSRPRAVPDGRRPCRVAGTGSAASAVSPVAVGHAEGGAEPHGAGGDRGPHAVLGTPATGQRTPLPRRRPVGGKRPSNRPTTTISGRGAPSHCLNATYRWEHENPGDPILQGRELRLGEDLPESRGRHQPVRLPADVGPIRAPLDRGTGLEPRGEVRAAGMHLDPEPLVLAPDLVVPAQFVLRDTLRSGAAPAGRGRLASPGTPTTGAAAGGFAS